MVLSPVERAPAMGIIARHGHMGAMWAMEPDYVYTHRTDKRLGLHDRDADEKRESPVR